jgi:hypothetical protein
MRWGLVAGGAAFVVAALVGIRIASNRGAAGGVDVLLSQLPPGYTATHGAVAFNALTGTAHLSGLVINHNGAAVLTAANVDISGIGSLVGGWPARIGHFTLADITAPPTLRHIDRVEADAIETGTLRTLFDPAAYPGGKPAFTDRRPVLGNLQIFGIVLHVQPPAGRDNTPYDITIKHEELADLSARQFAAPPTSEAMKQPAFASDLLTAIAFHATGGEEVRADVPGAGLVSIGHDTIKDYDGGKIGDYALRDISFVASKKPATLQLHEFELTGIDATKLIAQLATIAAEPKPSRPRMANGLHVEAFSLHGLKMDIPKAPLVTLDSIDSHTESAQGDFTDTAGTLRQLDIITTGRDLPAQTRETLQNFGMADFSIDMDAAGSFNAGTGHLIAKQDDFRFKGLGALHMTADIDGLKTNTTSPVAQAGAALQNGRLIHATLVWDDASLTSRLFHLAALRTGQSEEALRATLALPLASASAFFPDQPDVADQINAFLDGRHMLSVTLAPPTPVSFAEISAAGPAEKAHLLGVTIKGN